MERLQKIIANSGYCSRRHAEELILAGKVCVNGEVVRELGTKVSNKDDITVEGNSLLKDESVYFLLNKPRGIISSASDDKNRKTVVDLIKTDKRIYPVGRLDYDTTGVLLLTNDGELTNLLTHPKNEVDKIYVAKLNKILDIGDLKTLENGVIIDGYKTRKCKVKIKKIDKIKNTCMVEVRIHEGKNHQVKKMFNTLGYDVIKLKREVFAFLTTSGLKSGEYRTLSPKEVKQLYNIAKNGNRFSK